MNFALFIGTQQVHFTLLIVFLRPTSAKRVTSLYIFAFYKLLLVNFYFTLLKLWITSRPTTVAKNKSCETKSKHVSKIIHCRSTGWIRMVAILSIARHITTEEGLAWGGCMTEDVVADFNRLTKRKIKLVFPMLRTAFKLGFKFESSSKQTANQFSKAINWRKTTNQFSFD